MNNELKKLLDEVDLNDISDLDDITAENVDEILSKYDLNTVTHYWSELYINGKWIVVDARSATKNRWARTGFGCKG